MTKLVIDTSVIVKWLHEEDEDYLEQAGKILKDLQNNNVCLITPELAKYEVGNALLFGKKVSVSEAKVILDSLYSLPIEFISETAETAQKTYQLAKDSNNTYYDASFMALAQQENATLVTDNFKHQGKDSEIPVIALKNYPNKLNK